MRQNFVFVLGSRSRYLLPGIQKTFTVFKTKPRNFEIIGFLVFCLEIFYLSSSEFIFEAVLAEYTICFLFSN